MQLENLLNNIKPINHEAYTACIKHLDKVAKPIGSLGHLETLLAKIAAIHNDTNINIKPKCVLVFCADNGIVAEGVAQSDEKVTSAIAQMMAIKRSSVCIMAQAAGAEVFPIDVGMKDTVDGLLECKLMPGTDNMVKGPAMTRDTTIKAIQLGASLVKEKQAAGFRLIAVGEAGIGNSTTASAMATVLLERPIIEMTGRGAGLSDAGLERKRAAIEQAIIVNKPHPHNPLEVLSKVGGLDIAAMVGVFIGGAVYRVPIVMDGMISAVAALCATRLHPEIHNFIIPSHVSAEPAGEPLCRALNLEPILHAAMRLGEGTGAVALFPLLDMAAAVYHQAATFADIAVDEYRR